jgi:hypothetical protein
VSLSSDRKTRNNEPNSSTEKRSGLHLNAAPLGRIWQAKSAMIRTPIRRITTVYSAGE